MKYDQTISHSLYVSTFDYYSLVSYINECLLEVGDRDDDQQVKSCSEQSDEGQQNVNQHGVKVRTYCLPAGAVEELWKAEFSFL